MPVGWVAVGTNTAFQICMTGIPGTEYEVYAHENVEPPPETWEFIGTMTTGGELFDFLDFDIADRVRRFYHTRQVTDSQP